MKGRFLSLTLAFCLAGRSALADRVTVLPFTSGGGATSGLLSDVRNITGTAVEKLGHTLPTPSELVSAEMAAGSAQGSEQYRAAGRASRADWTLLGHVISTGGGYRVELVVCQVDTGRVESLAREVEPRLAEEQITEMLTLALRSEGVGMGEAPWERAKHPEPSPKTSPKIPPKAPPPKTPAASYGEGRPLALRAGASLLSAVRRPANASGSAESLGGTLSAGYTFVPGFEGSLRVGGALLGPSSMSFEAGARAMFSGGLRPLHVGPDMSLGVLATLGGDRTARFLARGALVASWGFSSQFSVEASPEVGVALGGSSSLVFLGGGARAAFRF